MIKKGFYLFLALFGLAFAAVPNVKEANMKMAKADSTFEVTKVSNQDIAGGWGLGLAIEFSPNLDGVDSVNQQINIACQKAGIPAGEEIELQRFEVVRHI